jgi:type IV pilus assembly protein PilC
MGSRLGGQGLSKLRGVKNMAHFNYRVKAPTGSVSEGVIDAPDLRAAMENLRRQKYLIVDINEAKPKSLFGGLNFGKGIKSGELSLFSRQLSTLVSSGVPIVQGLSILEEQITSPNFKKVIGSLRSDIESGISIADAMKKHPEAFSELYVSMISAGEVGGILDAILERLSSYLESAEALKGKVKSAMSYPMVVAFIAVGATLFLITAVIPQFATIFEDLGASLPLPTRLLLGLSDILRHYFYLVIIIPVGIVITFKQLYKRVKEFEYRVDSIKLNIPMFGILLRKMSIAKFTRTLGTLIKSGVPILQALETVAKTSGNKVIEVSVMNAREAIREGEKIADPLKRSGVFPPMVIQMIAVGEETGSLDVMLAKISDFYDREVDDAVKGLTSMIEPLIIVFMGGVIGTIVLAMFLPMMEMTSMMSQG